MKTAVVYQTETGFTKEVAARLAQLVQGDLFDWKKVRRDQLGDYEAIAYGGPLYASQVQGKKFLTKAPNWQDKKLLLFTTGMSEKTEDLVQLLKEKNLSQDQAKTIAFGYCRGGFNFQKLGFLNKLLMRAFRSKLKAELTKNRTDPSALAALKAFDEPKNWISHQEIEELGRLWLGETIKGQI